MTASDYYLPVAASTRRRAILVSILGGALTGASFDMLGASLSVSVSLCVAVAGAIQLTAQVRYARKPIKRRNRASASLVTARRYVLEAVAASVAVLLFEFLRVPAIEASVIDRKLRAATASGDYRDANQIVQYAIQNNVPFKQSSIDAVRRQATIKASATSAVQPNTPNLHRSDSEQSPNLTLAELEAYQIYAITGLQLRVSPDAIFFSTPKPEPSISMVSHTVDLGCASVIGEDRNRAVLLPAIQPTPESPAFFRFSGCSSSRDAILAQLTFMGRPESVSAVAGPAPVAAVNVESATSRLIMFQVTVLGLTQDLGNVVWVDVEFRNCVITYDTGFLYLKNVRFENCRFMAHNPKAQSILDHIRSASPGPVTLSQPAGK